MDFSLSLRGEKSVNHGIRINIESAQFRPLWDFPRPQLCKEQGWSRILTTETGGSLHCVPSEPSTLPMFFEMFRNAKKYPVRNGPGSV